MHKHIVGLFLLGSLIGCTSDWDPGRRVSAAAAESEPLIVAAPAPRRIRSDFAPLPDRGELLAYDRRHAAKQRGAFTSYPVSLSEEHAFRAAHEGGELVVAAPNGEQLRLKYDHHVEHPDGNWTWVGRDASGADAVLTFGDKAVFGDIPYAGEEPLRLTTSGGRAWLVATDRMRLKDANRATNRTGRPDYLVPPSTAALVGTATGAGIYAAPGDVARTASPSNTIDVVLGFTDGYANQLGGASVAITRLNNLLAAANQALANSLLTMRFRLVRTVQVDYPDATNNGLALEELSGYRSGTGTISVPAALRPLRTARDTYGGDLVSLVRAFRAPQNEGCGIAWLIGSGQRPITTADSRFGYSVVSDGTDFDEELDETYFCRAESLAHEMGHNMGQAHNEDDSEVAGTHAYSYGYREASSNGFYTVMAYSVEDSNQTGIRYFANPSVDYAGRPTGVANESDNARSMRQTTPVIAGFRATEVPLKGARNDINGDGNTDLLWSRPGTFVHWRMNGSDVLLGRSFPVNSTWKPIGVGDLNGDGRADVLWQATNGTVYVWMNTTGNGYAAPEVVGSNRAGWRLVGTGDTNGDGKDDLQWFKPGLLLHWRMDGSDVVLGRSFAVNSAWTAIGIGDLNGDGRADVIWRAPGDKIYAWMNTTGNAYGPSQLISTRPGWTLVGADDTNGDGKSDLQWFKTGLLVHWRMDGPDVVVGRSFPVNSAWTAIGVGDLNGDGRADVIWRGTEGRIYLWPNTTGNGYGPAEPVGERLGWRLFPTG